MVKKTNPNIPYSLNDFPKVLPQVKFFTKEPIENTQKEIKAFVGWDGIVIFDPSLDILQTLKIYAKQYQNYAQSCGRCTPGKYGGKVLYELLEKLQNYDYASDCEALKDIEKLKEVCELMKATSKCEVGKTTPNPILQILKERPEVFAKALPLSKQKDSSREKQAQSLNDLTEQLRQSTKKLQDAKDFVDKVQQSIESGVTPASLVHDVMQRIENIKATQEKEDLESIMIESARKIARENVDSIKETHKNPAEVSLSDFSGFQSKGEGSYLSGNDRALSVDAVAKQQIHTCKSAKSNKETTQNLDSKNCHIERSEISSIESNKDVSPFSKAQHDKILNANTADTENARKSAKNTTQEIKTHTLMPVTYNLTRDNSTENTFESLERYKSAITTKINNLEYISKITAPCTDECPSRVDIPAYIEGVKDMRYLDSLSSTRGSMPLAQVCGRVCPHPCENACRRAILDDPISIMELKRIGANIEFSKKQTSKWQGYSHPNNIEKREFANKSVGVIGAGPAGLSSAYYMALRGIKVDVYEALPVLGGEVAVGVPNYRMPINEYNHDIESLKSLGVIFHTNFLVDSRNISELEFKHDALVIAVGTRASKKLGCKNENTSLKGYLPAIKFMDSVNLAQKFNIGELPNLAGKKVVCVGGGFTSMDVVRCCVRLGASSVIMLYRRDEATIIKNTSKEEYHEACEEGVVFQFLSAVDEIIEQDSRIKALKINRYELIKSDTSSKGELKLIEDGGVMLECDILIPAVSQEMDFPLDSSFGVEISKWKTIAVDDASFSTTKKGIFAAGDCVSGPLTIVNAVGQGRRVASVVANFLQTGEVAINDDERMEDLLKQIGVFDKNREIKGFLSGNTRAVSDKLQPEYRAGNFEEVNLGFDNEMAINEAQRCMRCYYISMCVVGCDTESRLDSNNNKEALQKETT
ncbi:FAD-dependent oxidoreductase [Helicobacter bilis]|uniref:Formate dehydrogenase n=1 Tax=Helicobacter bilis TaxID=37372 RepID=A0A4U8U8Y9_9HELI|nr:FAD-dependent oxidoreductase [Helicobacter bilis]TLE08465.1 formate dehydrogenase [Helicobacter bilis]TLE10511.1 formate dehydrogenase [Helicobacter bilis]